ncbi:MAG: choice-of-anchor D domain-containing protein, partial [Candidatus Lokiarchaeota archaeon]|nr:choice-of-anchor D domain-containing protein [Candidatus Lokiarchaeota archaeon]
LPTHPDSGMFGGHVRALANIDVNPSRIYCGLKGGGIFLSVDHAGHWREINDGLSNRNILSVAIDPIKTNIIYAGTENGIFKSTDSAGSWKKIGLPNCHVNAIAIDPEDTNIIYAAVGNRIGYGYSEKGIWRSADGGENWIQPDTLEHKGFAVNVYTVLICKIGGKKKIIVGTSNGIWQSEDGLVWPYESHDNNLWTEPVNTLSVNPANSWEVYAGRSNDVYFSSDGGKIFSSDNRLFIDDKINCFTSNSQNLFIGTESRGLLIKDVSARYKNYTSTGLSNIKINSILLDPNDPGIVYCATPEGVYKSKDRAATFQKTITGLTAPQVNQHLINPLNPALFYAATTNGGFYSDNDGYSWHAMHNLPTSPINLFTVNSENGNELFAGVDKDWIYHSKDWGVNWEKLPYLSGDEQKSVYSIAVDPVNSYLFFGAENGVFRSAAPYNSFELKLPTQSPVQTLILKPDQPDTIFAGTELGKIYRGINRGDNWENVTNGFPPFSEIFDIKCSPYDSKIIWGCTEKGIYLSKNTGDRWDRLDAITIEHQEIRQLIIDPDRQGIMYVVTEDNGIYQSLDNGNTWRAFNENLYNYKNIISHVSFHPDSSKVLFASTLGKGIFQFQAEPIIHFATNPLKFGSVQVGKSDSLFSQVDNSGTLPLIIEDVVPSDPDVNFSLNSNVIHPNSATDFSISYTPQTQDTLQGRLFWKSNAFNSDTVLAVTGQGINSEIIIGESCGDFGFTPTNTTKKCSLLVENVGDADFDYTAKFMNHPDIYEIAPASGVIPQNSVTDFEISFTPVDTISYPDTLKFMSTDNEVIFYGDSLKSITGQGILGPGIELSATDHQFRPILPRDSDSWHFSIKNIGRETLEIYDIRCYECAVFTADPTTATIVTGSTVPIIVTFSSENKGQFRHCLLEIYSNSSFGDNVITLNGECVVNQPIIELNPETIDFGLVNIEDDKIDTILVLNNGDALLEVSDINWENPFLALSDTNFSLNAGVNKELILTYKPLDSDTLNEELIVVTNNAAGHDTVTVKGRSIAPTIVMPDTFDFGLVLINTKSTKELEIYNSGTADFHGEPSIFGKDAQYFDVSDTVLNIPQNENILNQVTFSPTEIGEYDAKLLLESDTFFNGDTVVLTGFCYSGPNISIEPNDSLIFPPTLVGSEAIKGLTVTNIGSDTLFIREYFSDASYFNESMDTTRLLARESSNITIYFKPDSNFRRPGTLNIISNSYDDTLLNLPLIGYGIAPEFKVEPELINFGDVNPGTVKRETVNITNIGNAALNINKIYLEHEDSDSIYRVIPDEIFKPIRPGNSAQFYIKFEPDFVSPKSLENTVIIESDAFAVGIYRLEVEGKCKDLEKPLIKHSKPVVIEKAQPIIISAEVTDSLSSIKNVWLRYRHGGVSQFKILVEMGAIEADSFSFTIPGDSVTTRGVEYIIFAEDGSENNNIVPDDNYFSIPVHVSGTGETRVNASGNAVFQPAGTGTGAYRIFSIPLNLEKPYPRDVVADDLEIYDTTRQRKEWRLADCKYPQYAPPDCYVFYNEGSDSVSNFAPGKGFFLIVKDEGKIIDSGAGTSLRTDQPFAIHLKQGWNLIGNPFNFAIPISQLLLGSKNTFTLWSFESRWSKISDENDQYLNPWNGYAIHTFSENESLLVYPNKNLLYKSNSLSKVENKYRWKFQIIAESDKLIDEMNFVGISDFSRDNYDKFDLPEPPSLGGIQLYFPHPDWGEYATNYAFDIRAPQKAGNYWDFKVTAEENINRIKLTFAEFGNVPQEYQIHLIDNDRKVARDVRANPEYFLFSQQKQRTDRSFRLIVGTENYIDENNSGISSIPEYYKLSNNYPNPFNPSTTIHYQLPELGQVKLYVTNILGQIVKTLVNEEWREAGIHTVLWNGCNEQNIQVASGIYLCVFTCGKYSQVNKMILLR